MSHNAKLLHLRMYDKYFVNFPIRFCIGEDAQSVGVIMQQKRVETNYKCTSCAGRHCIHLKV